MTNVQDRGENHTESPSQHDQTVAFGAVVEVPDQVRLAGIPATTIDTQSAAPK